MCHMYYLASKFGFNYKGLESAVMWYMIWVKYGDQQGVSTSVFTR